jgi:hypothetical protein
LSLIVRSHVIRALQKVTEKESAIRRILNFSHLQLGPLLLVDFINLLFSVIAIIIRKQYKNQFNTEVLFKDSFMLRIYNKESHWPMSPDDTKDHMDGHSLIIISFYRLLLLYTLLLIGKLVMGSYGWLFINIVWKGLLFWIL